MVVLDAASMMPKTPPAWGSHGVKTTLVSATCGHMCRPCRQQPTWLPVQRAAAHHVWAAEDVW
eukprot:365987-Chlamydomonas_euryale.AAC.24